MDLTLVTSRYWVNIFCHLLISCVIFYYRYVLAGSVDFTLIISRYWFNIFCRLLHDYYRYVPATVDHSDDLACSGTYLLHQGIQRRLQITIVHEAGGEYMWRDVTELVAGRIRTTPEWKQPDDADADDGSGEHNDDVLSLSLLPAHYIQRNGDDRVFFRFEAAWDSSLHNSPLLNRITPYGERVYMTISAYLDVSKQ